MVPKPIKSISVMMISSALVFSGSVAHAAGDKPASGVATQPSSETDISASRQPQMLAAASAFAILPPEVRVPPDVPLGQYRRMVQPFPNWILVCDENLKINRKVCNASQTFVGADKSIVFSWSLAATEDGQPYFILRAPPAVGANSTITLGIPDGGTLVSVAVRGCSESLCLAYQPAGPRLRNAVQKRLSVTISYTTTQSPSPVTISAPLEGLFDALAAI